jgi:TatD DNase family protein
MLDLHTHLYWKSYADDREAVIARARQAGVRQMFVVGTTIEESQKALELARAYPDFFAAVGLHPHEFNEGGSLAEGSLRPALNALRSLTEDQRTAALGECGLDYFSHEEGRVISVREKARQSEGFLAQIGLAQERQLPVIVHCRPSEGENDAYWDMLAIIRERPDTRFILHCYMGDTEVTRAFLELPQVFFSFTGNITYPVKKAVQGTKDDLSETVRLIPLSRLFVETDCPFLAPQGERGRRNEPAFVCETAERVMALLGVEKETLEEALDKNFSRVFPR